MSRMSRNKGKRGEREAAKELNRLFGLEARRAQQYCGEAGDADLLGVEGIHVEVKRVERFCLHPSLEQADSDRKSGETPIVLTRQNLKQWVFCCYLDDLPKVMERLAPDDETEEPVDGFPVPGPDPTFPSPGPHDK